jgi:hypothetical protein
MVSHTLNWLTFAALTTLRNISASPLPREYERQWGMEIPPQGICQFRNELNVKRRDHRDDCDCS